MYDPGRLKSSNWWIPLDRKTFNINPLALKQVSIIFAYWKAHLCFKHVKILIHNDYPYRGTENGFLNSPIMISYILIFNETVFHVDTRIFFNIQ